MVGDSPAGAGYGHDRACRGTELDPSRRRCDTLGRGQRVSPEFDDHRLVTHPATPAACRAGGESVVASPPSAWSRSAMRSRTSSRPTESRISSGVVPVAHLLLRGELLVRGGRRVDDQ